MSALVGLCTLQRLWATVLILSLAGCASDDFDSKGLSKNFKSDIDWVRDAFGQPIAKLAQDAPQGPFPSIPDDQRPIERSLKDRSAMIDGLKQDIDTARKIETSLAAGDPTHYLRLNGAKPTAQPLTLVSETVPLPDTIRDLDSFDPHHPPNASLLLAEIDFDEGSARVSDQSETALRRAAHLVDQDGLLRVMGYSASDRLVMEGRGPHEANRWLAIFRARQVAARLIDYGAPPDKLLVGSAPEAERGHGDKVEIIIDYSPEAR